MLPCFTEIEKQKENSQEWKVVEDESPQVFSNHETHLTTNFKVWTAKLQELNQWMVVILCPDKDHLKDLEEKLD